MEPRAFFSEVKDAFRVAADRVGTSEHHLTVAGRDVTISYAARILADRLEPALAHLASESVEHPTLRIHVWDSTESGSPPPPPPWGPYDYREKGRIRGFNENGIHTAYRQGEYVLYMYDEVSGDALFWTPDAASLPEYQTGSPFLTIFQWWAEHQGLTLIHSGAVGTEAGGILLTGPGGSGKSTTCLACALADGFEYLSDDYCLYDPAAQRAISLYCTGKLDAHSLNLLPQYESLIDEGSRRTDGKSVIYFSKAMPDRLVGSLPIYAVLLPNTAGKTEAEIRPASAAASLQALAPSTIFQLTGADRDSFRTMASLVRTVPNFHLDLSTHMRDVPGVIRDFIRGLT